jgi:hypothetical protein
MRTFALERDLKILRKLWAGSACPTSLGKSAAHSIEPSDKSWIDLVIDVEDEDRWVEIR